MVATLVIAVLTAGVFAAANAMRRGAPTPWALAYGFITSTAPFMAPAALAAEMPEFGMAASLLVAFGIAVALAVAAPSTATLSPSLPKAPRRQRAENTARDGVGRVPPLLRRSPANERAGRNAWVPWRG